MKKFINIFENNKKDNTDKILEKHTFNARIESSSKFPKNTIKVKIINKYNYVTHVYFMTNDNGILEGFYCDGSSSSCGSEFCNHCAAAYKYLKNTKEFTVKLPDETGDSEESGNNAPAGENDGAGDDDSEDDSKESDDDNCTDDNVKSEEDDSRKSDNDSSTDDDMKSVDDDSDGDNGESDNDNITDDDMKSEEDAPEDDSKKSDNNNEENKTEETYVPYKDEIDVDRGSDEPFVPVCMQINLGINSETGESIFISPNDTDQLLNNNIGIIGTMGTGKTQFTKSLVTQLYKQQSNNYDGTPLGILIFDYKGDYNETKRDFTELTNAKIIKPYRMPFNPLSLNLKNGNNKSLLPRHTANAFKYTLSKIYNLGPRQEGILFDCIIEAYKEQGIDSADQSTWTKPAPTFSMVYKQYQKSNAFNDNDKLAEVMKKLEGFEIFDSDPMKVVSLSKLLSGVVVIDVSDYDEDIQNLVVAITLDLFYAQMQTFGSSKTNGKYRQLKSFILVDEADNFLKMSFPSLRKIMKEGREFGVGTILSTQSLAHFCTGDDDYSKYIITWIIHKVNDLNRRNLETVLDQSQKTNDLEDRFVSIKELKKHESMVKISNNAPVIMYDKPFWELYNEITGRA